VVMDVLLEVLLHLLDHITEGLAEHVADEHTRHVQALLSVVITIVFGGSSQVGRDQAVDHVAGEEGLSELIGLTLSQMRQQLSSEDLLGFLDSLLSLGERLGTKLARVLVFNSRNNDSRLFSDIVEALLLGVQGSSIFEGGSQGLTQVGVGLIRHDHVEDLLVAFASQGSEQHDDGDLFTDTGDGSRDFTAPLSTLDIDLELEGWLIGLFVLRTDLSIPSVLAGGQSLVENQHDVTSLLFLGDNNLL